jgi:hypothetical protein
MQYFIPVAQDHPRGRSPWTATSPVTATSFCGILVSTESNCVPSILEFHGACEAMFVNAANIGDAAGPCAQPEKSWLDTRKRFHAAIVFASFENPVESFPKSCLGKPQYFLYVSRCLAHQYAVSSGKCLQSMTLKQTSFPAAPHSLWWSCGRAQCGSRIIFMSNTFFGASIHISLSSLVRLLYADCYDWGPSVREAAHEYKVSPGTVIRWYSRFRSLCAKDLDGLLIGGEGIVVEVPYQAIRTRHTENAGEGQSMPVPHYSPCFLRSFFRPSP